MRPFLAFALILSLAAVGSRSLGAVEFVRGDVNLDAAIDIADAIASLEHLFQGAPVECASAADANDDGAINIADPIFLVGYLFAGGAVIPPPFPDCAPDPTADLLTCVFSGPCLPTPAALPGGAVYGGPAMNRPRYNHTATLLASGLVLIVGGTDDGHLTAVDRVELFDQMAEVPAGEPTPPSVSGDFIDQDIDGDLIVLPGGGRFFHSATETSAGVLIVGGTDDILFGTSIGASEVFDPLTRSFDAIQISAANDIDTPRARHDATQLSDGRVLVTGGQQSSTVGPPIFPPQAARPSTEDVEIFDPATLAFSPATDTSGFPSELATARGRAGHTSARFAGFDDLYGSGDDVIGFIGGIMTLSALSLGAPEDYFPWSPLTTKVNSMDFYDTATGVITLAPGLVLNRRVNDPIATNLGARHPVTPFGDPGMANIVLVHGGDSDDACPHGVSSAGPGTTDHAELVVATFTGFGPGSGAVFTRVTGAAMSNPAVPASSNTLAFGHERAIAGCNEFNRSGAEGVLMDMVRTYDGQPVISSVVVTGGGSDQSLVGPNCVQTVDDFCGMPQVRGFAFYDPFYDIGSVGTTLPLDDDADNDGVPDDFPWDFSGNGTATNPLGIRGTWLDYDAAIPDETIAGYADAATPADAITLHLPEGRLMHTMTRIGGEDGLFGGVDDRIVVIGGTALYLPLYGGDAVSSSCEIFLPPDAGAPGP